MNFFYWDIDILATNSSIFHNLGIRYKIPKYMT